MKRIVPVMVLAGVAVLAFAGMWQSSLSDEADKRMLSNPIRERPQLGTLLHVWYGFDPETGESVGGVQSSHWDATVVVQPQQGFYSSDDPEVIAWQIDQMLEAGITWVLISWSGTGQPNLPTGFSPNTRIYEASHRAAKAVLDHILTLNGRMKATILVEPWTDVEVLFGEPLAISEQDKAGIWEAIHKELYTPYRSVWFEWEGKPLIASWMPMDIGPDDRFTYRRMSVYEDIPAPPTFPMDWNMLDTTDPAEFKKLVSADGFRKVSPRLNWFHLYMSGFRDEPLSIDPYFESGWYDSQWKWVLDNRNEIDLLVAWTWNEYHEQNFIEPTVTDLPVGVAEVYRDKTRFYMERLTSGKNYQRHQGPVVSVNDLRQMVGSIGYSELGLTSETELETFLSKIIGRAESHVARYLGGEISMPVPPAVEEIILRLASNIYNFSLKTRRGPLMQVGDFNVQLNDDAVFTDAIRQDLVKFKRVRGARVVYP